jgi:hypothetical protein
MSNWAKNDNSSSNDYSLGDWMYKRKKTEKERIIEEQINPLRINEMVENVLRKVEIFIYTII